MEYLEVSIPSTGELRRYPMKKIRKMLVKGLQSFFVRRILGDRVYTCGERRVNVSSIPEIIQIYLPGYITPLYPESTVLAALMGERAVIVNIVSESDYFTALRAESVKPLSTTICKSTEDGICVICQELLSLTTLRQIDSCRHKFHSACLLAWIESGSQKCPLCRA